MPVGGGPLSGPPGGVTLTLQADFAGTAFGGSPSWTDITGWWMSSSVDPGGGPVTIPWGRQDQSSVVESSSTSFTLNNADGRFTPGRSTLVTGGANPYYPNVRRHVRMRLTCTDGTTTVTLVDGLVDAWVVTPQTDGPTLATAELTDVFGRVSASTALRGIYAEEVLVDAPRSYYPLTEESGSTSFGDLQGHGSATLRNSKYGAATVTAGVPVDPTLALAGVGTGVSFTNSALTNGTQTVAAVDDTASLPSNLSSFSLEAWFVTTSNTLQDTALVAAIHPNGASAVALTTAGTTVGFYQPGNLLVSTTASDGKWHHLVGTYDGTTSRLYLDGALIGSGARTANTWTPAVGYIGGNLSSGWGVYGFTGSMAHVATYRTVLSASRVLAHYTAGVNAFAGESTATRWARLATYRPNLGAATSGTVGTVGSRDLAGMSLGDAFTDTATAEGGVIETHRGTLRLIGRSGNRNPTTTVTLNAANSEVDIPTTWRDDTQGFVNDVTVTRADGAAQRATSATSITADGTSQTSIDANVNSDRDAADMAGWTVAVGTQDELTSPTLTTNLNAKKNAALTLAVCALRTFDIVTLTNLPTSAPATSMSLQAQGGSLTVGADTFTATINTSAKPPQILRADATADAYTLLDGVNVIGW